MWSGTSLVHTSTSGVDDRGSNSSIDDASACAMEQDQQTEAPPPADEHHGQLKAPAIHLLAECPADVSKPQLDDIRASRPEEAASLGPDAGPRRFFSSAQWTADGTAILALSSDQSVSSFVLPADLLQPSGEARHLHRQASIRLPEPTQTLAAAPYFSLANPASQTFLVGCRDHPLHLYHAFPPPADEEDTASGARASRPLYTYKLIRKESEQYITPASLLWEHPGTHFVCGSANRIDLFDASGHCADGPALTVATIPSRRHIAKGSGVGMKGTVAALAASPPADVHGHGSILAAGTWTRWMGTYDLHRSDRVVANWSIAGADEKAFGVALGGQGIVQTAWSPCGRYLVVNERQAGGLLVYDIRGTGQLLAVLDGRGSTTQQRLHFDIFPGDNGFEVWAGTQQGAVAVWEGVGMRNDVVEPSWTWRAHESPVGSTIVHSSGSVVATCSGGWGYPREEDLDAASGDFDASHRSRIFDESSLKIWSVGGEGLA
ncbi:Guanine nucleotide-binding protein negative regulator 1 [Trichoderma ghanense]|uniref:Guanine nucleotide-binding protein negative regulator 1 n=1 Tax=Trichoderma ghanense TaxID=65468 RepID=A0ABY2GWX1_9HYPO